MKRSTFVAVILALLLSFSLITGGCDCNNPEALGVASDAGCL